MVGVAQLVRASDCGSEGRGFESHHPPHIKTPQVIGVFLLLCAQYIVLLKNQVRTMFYCDLSPQGDYHHMSVIVGNGVVNILRYHFRYLFAVLHV